MSVRRMFMLPEEETDYLNSSYPVWETVQDGRKWVLINNFPVPDGYNVRETTAAILIPTNYPFTTLDMVYFHPALSRVDGKAIPQTQGKMVIEGKSYQRWSRHYKDTWDPENDSLITHLMAIDDWLLREFRERS